MSHVLLTAIFLFGLNASAIFNYETQVPKILETYFSNVMNHPAAKAAYQTDIADNKCNSVYQNMIKDGVLDINYALGYFDDSAVGGPKRFARFTNGKGIEEYGRSPSLDIVVYNAIRNFMKAPCRNSNQLTCGFFEKGNPANGKVILEKDISMFGQKVLARMTLTQASASQNYDQNISTLAERQKALTLQSEANYFDAIRTSDIIFYNGHSRHGGGPDFMPVVLNSRGTPEYEQHYKIKRTGIRRTLAEVKARPDRDYILGLFACYSASYYQEALFLTRPGIQSIYSIDTIYYFDSLTSSLGYIEGFMHGLCGSDLSTLARQSDVVKKGIRDYNIGTTEFAKTKTKKFVPKNLLID